MDLCIAQTWDGLPARPGEAVALCLEGSEKGLSLCIDAPFFADPSPPSPPGPCWGLWDYEVVELFVCGPGEQYTEIEVGPYGHHLVLRLDGVRQIIERELALDFAVQRGEGRWQGRAEIPRAFLPDGPHRINAYAIHGQGEGRRYLCWSPTRGDAPDFHRLDAFVACDLDCLPAP